MKSFPIKFTLCLILFFVIHTLSENVNGETLKELQIHAFEHRDIIKKYQSELDISHAKVKEKQGEFLPSIDMAYTINRLNHDTVTGEMKENDYFKTELSWNTFAGFKDIYNLKAAQSMKNYSFHILESTRQDICLHVALKFLDVYRTIENLKVAEDETRLYKDRLRQIQLKYKVGILKKSDVLKVKVEHDNALQTERRARASVERSLNFLSFETGRALTREALDFSIFDNLPVRRIYHEYEALLLKNRSELNALKSSLKASDMGVKAARAAFYPQADLSLSYSSTTSDDYFIDSFASTDDEIRFQATISVNLFDGMKKQSKISQALMGTKAIGHDIKELENALKTELNNTLIDISVAFDNLEVAAAGKREAIENLRVTDLGFEQGIGTSSDVLDAIYNLSRSKFNEINAYTQVFSDDFQLQRLVENF